MPRRSSREHKCRPINFRPRSYRTCWPIWTHSNECRTQNEERRIEKKVFLHSAFCVLRSAFRFLMSELLIEPDFSVQRTLLEKTWSPATGLLGKLTDTG